MSVQNFQNGKLAIQELKKQVVWHPQFKSAYDRCQQIFREVQFGDEPSGFFLCGPTGAGKSTLTKILRASMASNTNLGNALYTYPNGSVTSNQMMMEILTTMNDPAPDRGTENKKRRRIIDGIRENNINLLIIDEFQHLLAGKNTSVNKLIATANAIKTIFDQSKNVSFLIVGTPQTLELWHNDPQLRSRLKTPFHLNYLAFDDDWKIAINSFVSTLNRFGFSVECDDLHLRIYAATQGSMRTLCRIFRRSAFFACEAGRNNLKRVDFSLACHEEVGISKAYSDGYARAFDNPIADVQMQVLHPRKPKMAPKKRTGTSALTV